jgi:hypothetical protein
VSTCVVGACLVVRGRFRVLWFGVGSEVSSIAEAIATVNLRNGKSKRYVLLMVFVVLNSCRDKRDSMASLGVQLNEIQRLYLCQEGTFW